MEKVQIILCCEEVDIEVVIWKNLSQENVMKIQDEFIIPIVFLVKDGELHQKYMGL